MYEIWLLIKCQYFSFSLMSLLNIDKPHTSSVGLLGVIEMGSLKQRTAQ